MSVIKDNEIKLLEKKEFATKDGCEWICYLDGNKPIGQVQVTYNTNDHKLIYKGEWKGDLANGYFNGYGELSRSDGSILKGTFKNGQFKKGKRIYQDFNKLKSFEGECKINENDILRKYSGKTHLLKGTLIYKNGGKFTGNWENCEQDGCYEIKEDNSSILRRGTFYNDSDYILKEGYTEVNYVNKKDKDDDEDEQRELKNCTDGNYDKNGKLINGTKRVFESRREWLYEWKDGKLINQKLVFIKGDHEKTSYEGEWIYQKKKEWIKGKYVESKSSKTGFKKGTEILYIKNKNKKPVKIKKIKGIFNEKLGECDVKSCIEGDIEYTHKNEEYFFDGKIKNSKFSEGKILFNQDIYKIKSIKGSFEGIKKFKKGEIVFKNGSKLNGIFNDYNFKSPYSISYGIINAKGILNIDNSQSIYYWYHSLFLKSVKLLIQKMVQENKVFPKRKIDYCQKKCSKDIKIKILSLDGKWKNDEFIEGKIKYTYLDGENHEVNLKNNKFIKINKDELIINEVNAALKNNSSKRSIDEIEIKTEINYKKQKKN